MNHLKYNGKPMSLLTRLASRDSSIPFGFWGPAPDFQSETLETVDQLTSMGYQQALGPGLSQLPLYMALMSQLCDVQFVSGDDLKSLKDQRWIWGRPEDIEHVKRVPVILGFVLQGDMVTSKNFQFPMLSFLPPPTLGEIALVEEPPNKETGATFYPYSIGNLDKQAQTIYLQLNNTILSLAGESRWVPFEAIAKEPIELINLRIDALQKSLEKPEWEEQWKVIQRMAKQLATAYYEYHQAHAQDRPRPIPPISDVFANGYASIWTALPFQAYTEAVSNAASGAKRWKEEQISEHMFRTSYTYSKPAGTTVIHLQSSSDEQNATVAREKVWQQVRSLGDLDGDVFLALVAQLLNGTRDKDGWTAISADKILEYRGRKPKTEKDTGYSAGHRQEDREDIAGCIARMRNTRITVNQTVYEEPQPGSKRGKDKSKGKGRSKTYRYNRESPLFQFGDVITRQELWKDNASRPVEVAWQVKESSWMEPFIQGTNRMVGRLLQSCLKYDPVHETHEKRLSKYLMFHLRTNNHSASITRNIGTLLEELSLSIDERNPVRTKDRFEKALDRLKKDGHIARWRYKENIDLPARKWLTTWLSQDIVFTAPTIIDENTTPKALS